MELGLERMPGTRNWGAIGPVEASPPEVPIGLGTVLLGAGLMDMAD